MAAAGSSESGVASTDMQLESSQEEMVLEDTAWEQYPLKNEKMKTFEIPFLYANLLLLDLRNDTHKEVTEATGEKLAIF